MSFQRKERIITEFNLRVYFKEIENDSRDGCVRLNNEAKLNANSLWVLSYQQRGRERRRVKVKETGRQTDSTVSRRMNNRISRPAGSRLRKCSWESKLKCAKWKVKGQSEGNRESVRENNLS